MKSIFISLLFVLTALGALAQAPQAINYQAKARAANGNTLTNQAIGVKMTILESSAVGTPVYTEVHAVSTDEFGIFTLQIGQGTPIIGLFPQIDWGSNIHYLKVELDATGGTNYQEMSVSQFVAVPYALYAETAGNGGGGGGSDDQTLTLTNDQLSIEDGNSVNLSPYKDNTDDQTLNFNSGSKQLSISAGNSVDLSSLSSSGGSFSLPHSGSYNGSIPVMELTYAPNGSSDNAFEIHNNGDDDGLAIFQGSSAADALDILNNGLGEAIEIDNGASAREAIDVDQDADDEGIYVSQDGVNNAGEFRVSGSSNSGDAIYARTSGSGRAGYFDGNVQVDGSLSKSGGSFKIDHPLDPANQYLYHSFVESPDMMNIYNGNVTTDANGLAVVKMPAWFNELNRDFRYQLTTIGSFARAMVQQKMQQSQFIIQTDQAHVEVSWQVTGIRKDPWAEAHRIPVEEAKPSDEKGYYLHPELYGKPESQSMDAAKNADEYNGEREERKKE